MAANPELNQNSGNTVQEPLEGAATNSQPPKRRPKSASTEGLPSPHAGSIVDGSAAPASDQVRGAAEPMQGAARQVAEFRLDEVELPPKSEAELRQIAKANELVDERASLDATVKEMAAKLRDLRRQRRKTIDEVETQNRIVTATGFAEAVPSDLRQRGFNEDRIKRLLTMIARTPLTPDGVAALIAPYMAK